MERTKLIPLLGLGLTLFFNKPHLIYGNSGYGGGSGTESDPYLISTPEHLNQLQLDVNVNGVNTTGKYYQLTKDIDLSGYDNDSDESNGNFTPIGKSSSVSFKGMFNGNGKMISNLKIILPNQDYIGLFGSISSSTATIRNVGLKDVVIEGNDYVGGLVGWQGYYSQINQSYSTGSLDGNTYVGGLVGSNYEGNILESYSRASVSGNNTVGGLTGYVMDGGVIEKSFATGDINGNDKIGGLVGSLSYGSVAESYSTGKVTGSGYTGGLLGEGVLVENGYWNIETSGRSNGTGYHPSGKEAGVGLTTSQMIGEDGKINMSGFDFNTTWKTTDSYPKLKWQPEEIIESTDTVKDVTVTGTVQTMVADVTIPSVSPDLLINPNLPEGFVAPKFSVSNDSVSPIKLELKTFEQTTNAFNDVMPDKYESWAGLNKQQSQDIALGLVAKEGEGWQTLTMPISYVVNHTNHEIGIIKPNSSVDFSFDVKHGTAFSEAKTVQYKMIFVFDLIN